jgi:hypothetical protein
LIPTNIDSYKFLELFIGSSPTITTIEDPPVEPNKKKQKAKKHVMNQNFDSTVEV